jgi:hypothetical protein
MPDIPDLTTRRAQAIAQSFMAAYARQRDAMRIVGRPSAELAAGDDGETIVADVAACMTVATALSPVGLTPVILDRMRVTEEAAFEALSRAAGAYFASEALRRDLGSPAAEPFRRLREALPASA